MARLIAAVHLTDPETRRPIVLQPGEEPAPHLAALITNEAAWEDGVLPDLAGADAVDGQGEGDIGATDGDDGQEPDADAETTESTPENTQDEPAALAEAKPARKTASRKPAAN
ncbi:hypothetical protein [Streptomyces sp. NPDC056169]|uniref:hypothetical protein n=1 Tax=Streptomyces sp. NPDC056169 TaxID=3345734 RepID=UPI0035D5DF04